MPITINDCSICLVVPVVEVDVLTHCYFEITCPICGELAYRDISEPKAVARAIAEWNENHPKEGIESNES